ncbi:AAA family ATPase, partial [Sulfurivirga sp.]|uniref:AAA family ATPase n=1 Tax=Sulfurivirga sp. TaxID=2614236 RepID=UPI0025F1F9C8
MRLKSIKLAGFKSFAEPARLTFPSNITCIVGPNGCGKSNTLDAIRWVMGESSARNLRGGELNDVLFNGTDRRRPVSQCSVELIFDNSDHRLKGPWNRYAEISVRRVHHREQGTQYYLNGQRCRKRDVQALFDGTGLGPRSYALIGQGNISQIIEARPEQLRLFLEEVAGIGFYRQRRREALSRLQATEENLAQLQIQHDTWQAQAETLRSQSESARRWRALREEIAQLRRRWFRLEFRRLKERQQQLEQAFQQQQQVSARLQLDVEAAQKSLLLTQKSMPALEERMTGARAQLHALDKQLALAEAARDEQVARRARLQQQVTQLEQQRAQVRGALDELEAARAALPEEGAVQAELDAIEREAAHLRAELEPLERQWQEVDRDLRALQYRRQECQSILNRLERERDQLEARLEAEQAALEAQQEE